MRKTCFIWLVTMLAVVVASVAQANQVFIDTFENGIVADSDTETNFWVNFTGAGTLTNIAESGGSWLISAGRTTGTSVSTYQRQSAVDSRFDFLSTGLVFKADAAVTSDELLSADFAAMRFMVSAGLGNLNANTDAIYVEYKENNTGKLVLKNSGVATTLQTFDLGAGTITSFSLALTVSNYNLVVYNTGVSNYTVSGSYSLAGDWSGGSALTFMAYAASGPGRVDVNVDNFSVSQVGTGYGTWASGYNLSSGMLDDADGDGLDNLTEYGWGGDPANGADQGHVPTSGLLSAGGTNWLEYVYARRTTENNGLNYWLELGVTLVGATNWSNSGYTELGAGSIDADFESVTNRIPATDNQKFVRLRIEAE